MKNLKRAILAFLLFSPLTALASGDEFLLVGFIQLLFIVILATILWFLKLKGEAKLLLFAVYILSMYLAFTYIDTGAYFENFSADTIAGIIPIVVVGAVYLGLRNKFRKG